ncbi:MAG TPA: hypothetical protein PKY59_27450 [Pyrinomonadaceae bacterium]|nr:hypothetical protein [Pyrinomonadaceae bacterium]
MKYAIFLSLFAAFSLSTFAQTKTVTNASLEKYKQARVKAEKEYRENYQKLGRPSPEEIDRLEAERKRETAELSARLTAERLQQEQLNAIRQHNEAVQRQNYYNNRQVVQPVYQNGYNFGFPSFGYYNNGRGFYNYNNVQRFPRQNYPRYDNPARFWSFTEIRPVPPRPIQYPVIIQPPPRD